MQQFREELVLLGSFLNLSKMRLHVKNFERHTVAMLFDLPFSSVIRKGSHAALHMPKGLY